MNKVELRKKYLQIRKNVTDKKLKSEIIEQRIIDSDFYKNSNVVALYSNLIDEVDTSLLIEASLILNKKVVLPKVISDTKMDFYLINSITDLKKGKFNIKEPISLNPFDPKLIDLMIIPGVCFDKNGNRIGFGKGYYDRYLENTNLLKIGICFDEQIIDNNYIDNDNHDVKLDGIISEKNFYTTYTKKIYIK